MTTDTRKDILFAAVDRFSAVHNEWADDDSASKYPPTAYWDAFDGLMACFDHGDIPAQCREMTMAVYSLGTIRAEWDRTDDLDPPYEFWAAREQLESLACKRASHSVIERLEPIPVLRKQEVNDAQIAQIWGLRNSDGSGKGWLIQKEIDSPGSVIGPDYVHPDDAARLSEVAKAKEAYDRALESLSQSLEAATLTPESSRDLWEQEVPIQQAAKMLDRDETELSAEWEEFSRLRKSAREVDAQSPTVDTDPSMIKPAATDEYGKIPPPAQETGPDKYDAFSEWTDKDLQKHAKKMGCVVRGNMRRDTLIDRILDAEGKEEGKIVPPEPTDELEAVPPEEIPLPQAAS